MQDWATFFFTGSSTLPAFMVFVNEEAFGLAMIVFLVLLITACLLGLRDQESPARQVSREGMERRRALERQSRERDPN